MGVKNIIVILVFLFTIATVIAYPPIPDTFKGNILIDNIQAPAGTEIKVYVDNILEDTITTTTLGKYDLYVKTGNSNDEIKFIINNIEAAKDKRQNGKTIILNLEVWNDRDNDGVNDTEDKLIGNSNSITDNYNNLIIKIDGSDNLTVLSGNKPVDFYDNTKKIISFEFNFDNTFNLFNIEIKKQTDTTGSIIVKGMPENTIKTVYIDKLTSTNNAVCIKDEEISAISEITTDCTGANEIKLNCPGTSGDYTCSIEENRFKISGLKHSGVKEFYIAPTDSGGNPPSSPGGGGSSGGGGGSGTKSCTENWECMGWLACKQDGTQTRICTDKNSCGTAINKPLEIQECAYEEKTQETPAENKTEEGITGITGAVIGFSKENSGKIVGIVAVILTIGLLWQFNIFSRITNIFKKNKNNKGNCF